MANEVLVGLKIGAVVSGSLNAAFGSAKSTVQQLGRATDGLTAKQKQMGAELAASLARGGSGIERMRRQYDQVGRTIEQLKGKQERLNTSIARGEALKSKRGELRSQAMETAGTAAVLGAPVVQSMRTAIDFQDQTRDIAITGGFDEAEETRLSNVMRGAALRWNQTQTDVANGTAVLIAGGISSAKELAAYAPVMAKAATATRASMDDLGSVAIALNDNLGIGAAGLERSMNMLAFAGKSGQFELADMAKWLPQLTPQFAALGITGERAVAEIGASLQIARRGAGSNDEAANNFKNFLSKLTAPETLKAFEKAGIDLKGSMKNLVSQGLSPAESMIKILTKHLGTKAPAAAAEYGKALEIKDDQERQIALSRLDEAYKLGELFADQQVLSFIRPALANQKDLNNIQSGSKNAADKGVLDEDWAKRMGSSKEQLKALRINLSDIGISVGNALLPALVDVSKAVVPLMQSFAAWAGENPAIIKGVVGLVGGLLLGKLAFIGVAYGANLVLSPITAMSTTITTLSAKWTLLRAMWQAGRFAPLVSGLGKGARAMRAVGNAASWLGRAAFNDLRSGMQAAGRGAAWLARGGMMLGRVLGGQLLMGLRLVGQAVLWIGRALMMNPIGLIITGIAVAAYLIYRYWEPIKGFFAGLWTEVKAGFSGGLSGIAGLIVNFSPAGLFYRAFAGVMSYFGIELPGKFSEFGGMIISGLVNGISNALVSAKDTVVGVGTSIKGWFTETLGIQSPSRVFMGYGANISEGAAIGIASQADLVRKAALGMAAQSAVNMAPPNPADVSRASMLSGASGAGPGGAPGAGGVQFHFSPQITVPGGAGVQEQVAQSLQAGYADFVRFMERYQHDKKRRSYGPADGGLA
ncbi:phage tail tape measure protein [Pseudomonas sp. B21-056]|jgi:TP901 family phage tail tape measure protein|uniref:phage tail tape measure protein n=1 Tax=Pseudomonas sp. B21-056 TaxID=2895495 RepID=UPI002232BCB9|nr:phage tail tape measure protein [Pseudomonas sp. B21-056]UZE21856.1 phage tail tape measure protein [Pseudomonas sp. B21-056]